MEKTEFSEIMPFNRNIFLKPMNPGKMFLNKI